MNDVLDKERIERFAKKREELIAKKVEKEIRMENLKKLQGQLSLEIHDLCRQIGEAGRILKTAERPLSEYIADVVRDHDENRGYFKQVVAEANVRKNRDVLQATGAPMPKAYQLIH